MSFDHSTPLCRFFLLRTFDPAQLFLLSVCRDSEDVYLHAPLFYPAGCDAKFFGELMEELAEVVGCFNTRAQQLLKLHMATGLRKYFLRRKCKLDGNREAMIQEGQMLVNYASMNALAVHKILKKYDKVLNLSVMYILFLFSFQLCNRCHGLLSFR